ncbi:uncharacterized protein RHO25_008510 [Cercospora beticola]|uniref:non-specific serine/threonine protein kinase n=1 Tax=Cercospora beticola TaxID=122368 RepID=A0ABZ0NWJ9_CERBT|nr:hypothetical protein RHO25_008510 [Cercospora beticola]
MATFGAQSFAHFMAAIEQRGFEWQNQNYIFPVAMATWINFWNTRLAGRRAGHDALNAIQTYERVRGKAESDNVARENHATETAAANGTVTDAHVRELFRDHHKHCRKVISSQNALIDSVERLRICLANHVLNAHFDLWITRTRLTAENTLKEAQKTLTTIVDSLRDEFRKDKINEELFPDGQWSCVQVFTSGINTTGLWVRHTPTNMIVDRVVRKVEYKTQTAWDDDKWWHNAVNNNGEVEQVSNEAYFTKKCGEAEPSVYFVRLREWNIDEKFREINIYTHYCGLGDLHGLCKKHQETWLPMPESWLRYLFLQLAEACIIMEEGPIDDDWPEEVVHRDIKPANIFLEPNTSGRFPAYPLPRIADFGLAIGTSKDAQDDPFLFAEQHAGTPWFRAPEQINSTVLIDSPTKYQKWEVGNDEQILSRSNIYGIGMTMYWLVRKTGMDLRHCPFDGPDDQRKIKSYHECYSKGLIKLIEACIQKLPTERIGPRELRSGLAELMSANNYEANAYEGNQPQTLATSWKDLHHLPSPENYRVGFAHHDLADIFARRA